MIKLLPNTSEQTMLIVPRVFPTLEAPFSNISLVITEDGTNISETFTELDASVDSNNSNYVSVSVSFAILREGYGYFLEFSKGGQLWFRDKAYVTSQTSKTIKHTLNTNEYAQFDNQESDQYIIL